MEGADVETAIRDVLVTKHGVIGGTSAGMVSLGQFLFSAANGSVISSEALADPFSSLVTLDPNFVGNDQVVRTYPFLANIVNDTHLVQRDRMGRFVTFLSRLSNPTDPGYKGWVSGPAVRGIGADNLTAVEIGLDSSMPDYGIASVVTDPVSTKNNAYVPRGAFFLSGPNPGAPLTAGSPLTSSTIQVVGVAPGGTFDLRMWRSASGKAYSVAATGGVLTSTAPDGSLYFT